MEEIPNLDSPLVVTINPLHVPTHNGIAAQGLYLEEVQVNY